MSPVTLLPYLISLSPPQVERIYFQCGQRAFSLSASSVEIIEALLRLSIIA